MGERERLTQFTWGVDFSTVFKSKGGFHRTRPTREWPESNFRLTSSRRCPLRNSPSCGSPSSSPPFSWSIAPFFLFISSVPVLRLPPSTLRPISLSSMFGIPIDTGSFLEGDFLGPEITVPRRDGDGRSNDVGTSLDGSMDFGRYLVHPTTADDRGFFKGVWNYFCFNPRRLHLTIGRGTSIFHNRLRFISMVRDIDKKRLCV